MRKFVFMFLLVLAVSLFFSKAGLCIKKQIIDNFDRTTNLLGGRSNTYQKAPSQALTRRVELERGGKKENVLKIKYDKEFGGALSGWCGYYTLLDKGNKSFDASGYEKLTFWVRGEKGEESFNVGLADKHWQEVGDSLKSKEIGEYLKTGEITTKWQKAEIPLDIYFLDLDDLVSISINFQPDVFTEDAQGTLYIDEIAFE